MNLYIPGRYHVLNIIPILNFLDLFGRSLGALKKVVPIQHFGIRGHAGLSTLRQLAMGLCCHCCTSCNQSIIGIIFRSYISGIYLISIIFVGPIEPEKNKLVQFSAVAIHESLGCASLEQCTDFSEGPWWEKKAA